MIKKNNMSIADKIFIQNCTDILNNGFSDENCIVRPKWIDGSSAHTIKKFCVVNRYDLSKEFPILTIRKSPFKLAIDELLWIWQKKSNKTSELKSKIWDAWTDKNGTIGKAYGYQLSIKHKYKEGMFDQVDRVLFDLKHNPYTRRMVTNIFNHNDLYEMNLYPCAYSMTFNVTGNKLNGILNQRSNDFAVANNWNVVQYAILIHMFAQVSNLEVGELVHVVADMHIYDRHIDMLKQMIQNKMYDAPKLIINKDIKDFYKFTVNDFELKDYNYSDFNHKFEVAV